MAITKSDLIDEELKELISSDIPENVSYVFISSIAQIGLIALKDKLWQLLKK